MKRWLARYAMLPFEVLALLWFALGVGVAVDAELREFHDGVKYPLGVLLREVATRASRANLLAVFHHEFTLITLGVTLLVLSVTARTRLSTAKAWRVLAWVILVLAAPAAILGTIYAVMYLPGFLVGGFTIDGETTFENDLLLGGFALLWVAAFLRVLIARQAQPSQQAATAG